MATVMFVLAVLAFVIPLWIAFSTTAAAAVYLVAGTIGYMLD
jgi:hypothetical protein